MENEWRHDKTCFRGFRPSPAQTGCTKMVRGLEFRIYEVEGLYYHCSENKDVIVQLICVFVFTYYAKSRFPNDAAQMA